MHHEAFERNVNKAQIGIKIKFISCLLEILVMKFDGNRDFTLQPIYIYRICVLLGCYAPYSGKSLLMFRDNLWVPSSGLKKSK